MLIIKVADAIVKMFIRAEIPYVFGIAGTSILDLMDATDREEGIEFISARSEDNAAHMADGYARVSGKVGVCAAHVGPGAVKMFYGVTAAYKDGIPLLVITGNEVTKNLGRDSYHEVDIKSIYQPVTKAALQVTDPEKACSMIARALVLATSGKPAPVHIDLPKDIAAAEIDFTEEKLNELLSFLNGEALTVPLYRTNSDNEKIKRSVELLKEARYPLIFAGAGVIRSNAEDTLRDFVEARQLPVVTTDGGRGLIPEDHSCSLGVVARQAGDNTARQALGKADLILGIGLTFSDVSTFEWSAVPETARLIQVDINPREISRQYPVDLPVVADAREYLEQLSREYAADTDTEDTDTDWELERLKGDLTAEREEYYTLAAESGNGVNPWKVIVNLNKHLKEDTFISVDSGLHSFFGKKLYVRGKKTYIRSAGFGAMGYPYPALLGALLDAPEGHAVSIMGDGCFSMISHELESAKRLNLPLTCIIFNNHIFGSQHYHQENKYEGRFVGTEFNNPDFSAMADLYNLKSWRIETDEELEEVLPRVLQMNEPTLLDLQLDPEIVPTNWTSGSGLKKTVKK